MNPSQLKTAMEAGSQTSPAASEENRCFIVFVGREKFGLPVSGVQTIFQIDAVTPVPLGPREILGLVNLRGKIVTAVSLRRRLQMEEIEGAVTALAIGVEHRGESFALVIDEVGDVIVLDHHMRIPKPPHLESQKARLTEAIYRLEDGILPLLDMSAVFDFQRRP
jgi:purine-binding chemotaxis protein CheW